MRLLILPLIFHLSLSAQETPEAETSEKPAETKTYSVKQAPLKISETLEGVLIPTQTQEIILSPQAWSSYKILTAPEHGQLIKQGEPILIFDSEEIDLKLIQLRANSEKKELELAIAKRELVELEQKNALSLQQAKTKLNHAEADLAYFDKTELPARKTDLAHQLDNAKNRVLYQNEELTQLMKMYQEDDLTEETEEIILVRQRNALKQAEHSLTQTQRSQKEVLTFNLPRQRKKMANEVESLKIDYATAKLNLDRKFQLKSLAVATIEREAKLLLKALAKTQSDHDEMTLYAEFDGHIHFGTFRDGQWHPGKTAEFLKPQGKAPLHQTFLTLVATDSPLNFVASIAYQDLEKWTQLLKDFPEVNDLPTLSERPTLSNQFLASLTLEPSDSQKFPGLKIPQEFVFFEAEEAILIPQTALKTEEDGSSSVSLQAPEADLPPTNRTVKIGKKFDERVQILSGLAEGEIILLQP